MLFICYPKCSTCKKAREWLEKNKFEFEERDIKKENPTKEELEKWIEESNLDIKKFFNTSGLKYKELNLKERLKDMTKEEKIKLLSSDGMLVKRPILISDNNILVGFREKEWEEILK